MMPSMVRTIMIIIVHMAFALADHPSLSSIMISMAARWTVAETRKITALMVVMDRMKK